MAFNVISIIDIDMAFPNANIVNAVQYDSSGRVVKAHLYNNGQSWAVPSGVYPVVRYQKSDRLGGFYDTDENGSYAFAFEDDRTTVNVTLALQALTTPGDVDVQINFYNNVGQRVTAFAFKLRVQRSVVPDSSIISSTYYNALTAVLQQVVAAGNISELATAAASSAASAASSAASAREYTPQIVSQELPTIANNWLGANISNPSNPPLDRSLSLSNAAAPADLAGKAQNALISYPFQFEPDGTYINRHNGNMDSFPEGPYIASTWIPIMSSILYMYTAGAADASGYAFYDEQKQFISGGYYDAVTLYEFKVPVPANARYFRFTCFATLRNGPYVKGVPDRSYDNFCDHIPLDKDTAYDLGTGIEIHNISGVKATGALLLHSMEPRLKGYRYIGDFYKTLYDENNNYVGSIRYSGDYYDKYGNKVNDPIDYYSFAITVSNAWYTTFLEQELYFEQPIKKHFKINVSSVAQLEAAMLKAAEMATPYRIYDIYIAEGTYDLWNGLDHSKFSGSGDTAFGRGLELVSYCNLYGLGVCVLDLTIPSDQRQYSTRIACINTHGAESIIKNLRLTTYDGRYCVHDDSFPNITQDKTIIWEDCIFDYRGRPDETYTGAQHCYGAGYWKGFKAIFKNCIFTGGNVSEIGGSGEWVGVAIHDHGAENTPFYCDIDSCAFVGVGSAVLLHATAQSNGRPYIAHVDNSYIAAGNKIYLKGYGGADLFVAGCSEVAFRQDAANTIYYIP